MIGLQRGLRLRQKAAPVMEEEEEVSAERPGLIDDFASASEQAVTFASVSVLGLQRSATLRKRPNVALEGASPHGQVVSMSLAKEPEPAAPPHPGQFSLKDGSLLGLQRSAKIVRRQPPRAAPDLEDERKASVTLGKEMRSAPSHSDGLALKDVSLLGLQRSAKIIRRQPLREPPSVAETQQPSIAGASLLGLQRSIRFTPGGASKKSAPLVEDLEP